MHQMNYGRDKIDIFLAIPIKAYLKDQSLFSPIELLLLTVICCITLKRPSKCKNGKVRCIVIILTIRAVSNKFNYKDHTNEIT